MKSLYPRHRFRKLKSSILAASLCVVAGSVQAIKLDTSPEWDVNFDNSIQYTMGWRAQSMDSNIGNQLFFSQGDYKFKNKGDMVTNRIQDLIEFQGVYQGKAGFRTTASVWKDYAYNDSANQNPAYSGINSYGPSGKYSTTTDRYFLQGGEFLDAFVFANGEVAGNPSYAKVGRLTQYWGNAFFFGFTNIAYSQSPIDYIKGFSQPGSEVKELFLPRKQILLSTDLASNLSVTAQYFFEYAPNRYPEAGTYLGFFDVLFNGPPGTGALAGYGITANDGMVKPPNNDQNFGIKVSWAPEWVGGDMGFYYRQLDEVDPWAALLSKTGHLQDTFARKVKLFGISYEKSFGLISTAFELNTRNHTALNSAPLVMTDQGATGTITNFIGNTFVQLGTTPFWDTGILLAEFSYTHLNSVTGNKSMYNGVGTANCVKGGTASPGDWHDGCSTDNTLAIAALFDPQWLQVRPGWDLDTPISYTMGVHGNGAYRAGAFYAQDSKIYSVGVKATYQGKTSVELQYNGYYWAPNGVGDNGLKAGLQAYPGFGGNGPVSLNDRGWVQLTLKSSF